MTPLDEILGRYVIKLPPGMKLITSNSLRDSRIIRDIRETSSRIAIELGIPRQHYVKVRGVYYYPDNKRHDPGNYSIAVKAMIDGGLVDTKIIPDDNDKYLTNEGIHRGYPNVAGGQLALVVQGSGTGYKFGRMWLWK